MRCAEAVEQAIGVVALALVECGPPILDLGRMRAFSGGTRLLEKYPALWFTAGASDRHRHGTVAP